MYKKQFFTKIKFGYKGFEKKIVVRKFQRCDELLKCFLETGFISSFHIEKENLVVYLKYEKNVPAMKSLNAINTFKTVKELVVLNKRFARTIFIISTDIGIMVHKKAIGLNLGGVLVVQLT